MMLPMHRSENMELFTFHADSQDLSEIEIIEDIEFAKEEMYVIYEGCVAVENIFDGNVCEIDYLTKGAIIRPYHFLVNRISRVRFRVIEQCLIYRLRLEVLILLSMDYPELKSCLSKVIRV